MSIVNFEQLNEILESSWIKTKEKIKEIADDYVSKTLPNNVIGETVFNDGYIEGATLNHFNNKNSQMHIGNGSGDCFGVPNNSVNAGVHVGRIALAVNPSLVVGSNVNSVVALAVRKRNNEVMEVITQNSQAKVYKNPYRSITADKIIYIDINKKFSEEVYFVIGCNGLLWNTDTPPRANVYGSSTIPAVGDSLTIADYGYSGRFIIFTGKTSFEELVSKKNDSVSKTKDNILTGKTILQDGYIDGELYSYNNPNIAGAANGNSIYSGTNNKIIQSNQHVTSIIIAVNNDLELGATVTGVNIGVVRHSDNQVMEYIVQNGTATVVENNYPQRINATRVINVLVDKKWAEDVYFIVGANGMLWGEARYTPGVSTATGGTRLPNVGSTIGNLNRTNYVGKVIALGSNISLNTITSKVDVSEIGNEANKIPRVGTNGKLDPSILPAEQNGGVRTVNGQSPGENGNVTVLAEHIKYVDGQNTTVKGAIDNKVNVSDTVTSSQAGKIVKLDGSGKLNDNMLPATVAKQINGQTVRNNDVTIYSDNIAIDSSNPNKNIKQALEERAHKNQDNTFTKRNTFDGHSPRVNRLFTRKHINSNVTNNSNLATYQHNKYFAPVNEVYTDRNKRITHLLLPVRGASVGEQIAIDVFAFNNNKRLIQLGTAKKYPVVDEEIAGCKCVKITFDIDSGTNGIGFGFMIMSTGVGAVCVQGGSNVAWTSNTRPTETTTLNPNENISFPYKICYETTSELVTRFELENVTQMYPKTLIGEMKQLSYDAGNSLEDGTNTWLRANGQAINSNDYPELYEKFNIDRTNDDIAVSIPSVDNQIGYYYICAK
nr:hypothetical protein [uncultured Clostridium sp.]